MNQASYMIRLKTSIILLFHLFIASVYSQNAYDFEHTVKFGQYLYNTNQYQLAAQEFERAVYFQPNDSLSNFMLFKTYSVLNRTEKALNGYRKYSGDFDLSGMPDSYGTLYASLLIKNGNYSECLSFIDKNCCLSNKSKYLVSTYLVKKEWDKAWAEAESLNKNQPEVSPLLNLVDQSKHIKHRSPALGAVFSAIIPGTGKLYAGAWQDAIIGFLMTSTSGYLAYRSFDKYGIRNPYTWFLGAVAIGYYSGNVYGGYNAVRKYNLKQEQTIVDETKRYISDF